MLIWYLLYSIYKLDVSTIIRSNVVCACDQLCEIDCRTHEKRSKQLSCTTHNYWWWNRRYHWFTFLNFHKQWALYHPWFKDIYVNRWWHCQFLLGMINVAFISTNNLKDGPGNNESIHNAKYFTNRAALYCAIIHNSYDVNLTWPIISWLIALENSTNNYNVTNYAIKIKTTSWYVILDSQEYHKVILLIISFSINNNIRIIASYQERIHIYGFVDIYTMRTTLMTLDTI